MSKVKITVVYEYEINPENYSLEVNTDSKRMVHDEINLTEQGIPVNEIATIIDEKWELVE